MKSKILFYLCIVICFSLSSCIFTSDITPIEKASIISKNTTNSYIELYNSISNIEETDQNKEKLAEVKKLMNEVKEKISAYNNIIVLIREGRKGVSVSDLDYDSIQLIITNINNLMIELLE